MHWVEQSTILLSEVGSRLFGTNNETSDRDEMGVCLEPLNRVAGLTHPFEQKTNSVIEGAEVDRTVYGLRKYCRLALSGNPTLLCLLFAPSEFLISCTPVGSELQELADCFASRKAGAAFLGYLTQQKQRLLGERGQKNVNRKELTEKFGFDTKYAGHIIRLGYQGVEYLTTGRLSLPLKEQERQRILAIRNGNVPFNDVLSEAGELEQQLKDLRNNSPLPEHPNDERVNEWLLDTLWIHWQNTGEPRHAVGD